MYRVYIRGILVFLESVYEKCILVELSKAWFQTELQKAITVHYKGDVVSVFAADIIVEVTFILEYGKSKRTQPLMNRITIIQFILLSCQKVTSFVS